MREQPGLREARLRREFATQHFEFRNSQARNGWRSSRRREDAALD